MAQSPTRVTNQAQAAVVGSLEGIVDVLESLGIELAQLGLDAEIAADAVAHGLRADDAGAHHFGGVKASSTSKWLG